MQKQGGIFQKWFKEFTSAVFSQILHAVIFGAAIISISEIKKTSLAQSGFFGEELSKQMLCSFIAIIGCSSITRFEKIVKELFGIGGSSLLGDNKQNMAKFMMGTKSAASLGKSVYTPVKQGIDANKKLRSLEQKKADRIKSGEWQEGPNGYVGRRKESYDAIEKSSSAGTNFDSSTSSINPDSASGGTYETSNVNPDSAAAMARSASNEAVTRQREIMQQVNENNNGAQNSLNSRLKDVPAASTGTQSSGPKSRKEELEEYKYNKMKEEKDKKAQDEIDEYNAAKKAARSANMNTLFSVGAAVAGVGIAGGAFDELSEITTVGNMIAQPVTKVATDKISRNENVKIQDTIYGAAKSSGMSETEISQKVKVSADFVNDPGLMEKISKGIAKERDKIEENIAKSGGLGKAAVINAVDTLVVDVDVAQKVR